MAAYNLPQSRDYAISLVEARAAESPAAKCAVINCKNAASDGDENVKFYTFPDDPAERITWVLLLGRVDRSRKPWQIRRSAVHYVCSRHFLGNRRLLIPETDHYYPSIFPAISYEHCLPNVRSGEEKCALYPRPAGFYKHRPILKEGSSENVADVKVYRESLPDLDEDGLKWSELQDFAYEEIYLPFVNEFNNLISETRLQDKKTHLAVNDISKKLDNLRIQMNTSFQRMIERNRRAQTEINIYSPGRPQLEQNRINAPAPNRISDRPPGRAKMHSYVFGPDDVRIPIDVTMPSIQKDWTRLQVKELRQGDKVYVFDRTGSWVQAIVLEVDYNVSFVRVKIRNTTKHCGRPMSEVAYGSPSPTQIPLGCRVLAGTLSQESGVVMEYPKWQNSNRYLILFEDGRWAYHNHVSIFLICKQTSQNWQHVDPRIQQTVKDFFMTTEHPLLRVAVGQKISAEKDKQWFDSQVVALDGNLIQVTFYHYGTKFAVEWLYAGSARLQEIYNLQNPSSTTTRKHAKRMVGRKANGPYVEYTDDAMDVITLSDDEEDRDDTRNQKKNTARKSTSQPPARTKTSGSAIVGDPGFVGSVVNDTVEPLTKPKDFVPHKCEPNCLPVNEDPLKFTAHSPYLLPHVMAWRRLVVKAGEDRVVIYKAPCGKSLRDEIETFHYLLVTGSKLRIGHFCFDPAFELYAVWKPKYEKIFIEDITKGEEPYPISFVNGVDSVEEELAPYWSQRRPTRAAEQTMILEEEFLPCCSCTDECLDRSKCQCQRQTIAVSDAVSGEIDEKAGYTFGSLSDIQLTGIYECNSRCSCKPQCVNKVAQSGIQVRMQLFKTQKKGLGVRTLHDIPKGRFLCTYAGTILTDTEAEASAQDTYFANLDHIDVVTLNKEDYESSVSDIEDDTYAPDGSDEEVMPKKRVDKDLSRQIHYGNGDCFVMDALEGGNIGRYFNHSCEPNIFVQNVFVDTHDLRLPWLGFFTDRLIKAGEELTWDYRYEVGSVKGKKLPCYCNSSNCRKRLL